MYRQIKVHDADTKFHKILRRYQQDQDIRVFALTTVTQSTVAAPFLAARTLLQLAKEEGNKYPLAAEPLKGSFYVDDLRTGTNTMQETMTLKNQFKNILKRVRFELHKWA